MATQVSLIKAHLEAGKSITAMSAIAVYGVFRLSSVIEDLRATGMEIDCILKRDEMGKQYGEYRVRHPITIGSEVQVKPGHAYGLPNWVRKLRNATVVGKREVTNGVSGGARSETFLVRFVRGQNLKDVWLMDKELVNVGS